VQSYVDQMSEIREQYAQEEAKTKIKRISGFTSGLMGGGGGDKKPKNKTVNKYAD
jgi:hypothetical protein